MFARILANSLSIENGAEEEGADEEAPAVLLVVVGNETVSGWTWTGGVVVCNVEDSVGSATRNESFKEYFRKI